MAPEPPKGALVVAVDKQGGEPFFEAKWRWQGKQKKKRLGRAWLEPANGYSGKRRRTRWERWITRAGSARDGYLSEPDAQRLMRRAIRAEIEKQEQREEVTSSLRFEDVAKEWLQQGRKIAGWKPSTERDYATLLRDEDDRPQKRGQAPRARIMKSFAGEPIDQISEPQIRSFLKDLDHEVTSRTVNKHRQVLLSIFEYAVAEGLRQDNPVAALPKRREADPRELVVLSPDQVQAVAAEAQDEQTKALIIVAAFTGLRLGEILALRWLDVRFSEHALVVGRSYTAGIGPSVPKSGKARSVPLAEQPAVRAEADRRCNIGLRRSRLLHRERQLLGSRRRPAQVQASAGEGAEADREIPEARFHDLRHCFGSLLASAGIPMRDIQEFMGHAIRARPRSTSTTFRRLTRRRG